MIKDGYSICFNEWALDKDIKNELGLLLIISSLTAEKGFCFASNEYFAKLFETNESVISRKLKKLEGKGYIKISYQRRGAEIISREIRLTKLSTDDLQKSQPTIDEKVKDKNTSNNNIYCPSDDERDSQLSFSGENKAKQKEGTHELTDEEKFEVIWQRYPRKEGKNEAYRHYCSWLKGKTYCGKKVKLTQRQMWFAVCKYNDYVRENKIEKRFIQMGSTFFNSTIYEYLATEEEIEAHTK